MEIFLRVLYSIAELSNVSFMYVALVLILIACGLPKSPLFAQDETNFYLKVVDARIEFVKDTDGNVTGLIAHYLGKDDVCKKIK